MGWKIITNHTDSWEIYSTSTDGVVAQFNTEQALNNWIAQEHIYDGKLKAIEHLMTFPSQWTVNDERIIVQGSLSKFHTWCEKHVYNEDREENFKQIDQKLEDLMNAKA